jgi:hypothetical protein
MIKSFFLTLFITLSFAAFNTQCGEKPGEGELAKKGYENAKPIIEALEKYRQEKISFASFDFNFYHDFIDLPHLRACAYASQGSINRDKTKYHWQNHQAPARFHKRPGEKKDHCTHRSH